MACWVIVHASVVVWWLFSKWTFSKNSFRNTIRVSNSLDLDQDRCSVGPDLGPNCLQRLSPDDKSGHKQGNSETPMLTYPERLEVWAMTCDFQQCGVLTSVDSDKPVQPPFMLRNSKWCSLSSLTLVVYSSD